MELVILIKCSFINKIIWRISPFHIALFFSTIYINSCELIILIRNSLWSFTIKGVIFKTSSILELFGNILALLTVSKIIFHWPSKMRTILHNIKAISLCFSSRKIPNKQRSIFLIHSTNFIRSSNLQIKQKNTISNGP
jgi:hypothetical protein